MQAQDSKRQSLHTFCSAKPAGTTSADLNPDRICPSACVTQVLLLDIWQRHREGRTAGTTGNEGRPSPEA